MITIQDAMARLIIAMKEDPDYRATWQVNIAMAFKDEADKYKVGGNYVLDTGDLHKLANMAADRFLNILCYKPKSDNDRL